MKIEKEFINDKTVIIIPFEEVEVYNASELRDEINEIFEKGYKNLIIDLVNVEYIDSSGLGVLVSALKKVKTISGYLILLSPKNAIKQVLELTSLNKVFTILYDKNEALKMVENHNI